MKLFVSGAFGENDFIGNKFQVVSNIDDSNAVLILPGGLGTFSDMFLGIKLNKKVIVYNKDLYYSSLFKNLYEGYEKGLIESAPSVYLSIESEPDKIIELLEDLEK